MNKSTLGTVIVVAGVALAAYLVYKHFQTVQGTNTLGGFFGSGGSGIGGNLNLNTLIGDLGGIFSGGTNTSGSSGSDSGGTDGSDDGYTGP
jgi:hypothetical protein